MAHDYSITMPKNTTDFQMVAILKQILPRILVNKFKYNPNNTKLLAENLAPKIADYARAGSQLKLLKDQTNKLNLIAPTQQQCDEFQKALEEIVVIRYGDPASHKIAKVKVYSGETVVIRLRGQELG